jgi:Tfp pilus assembly major pilin PilA
VIGILAAVAIPAYSAYTKKAKAAQGAALTVPVQVAAYSAPLSLMSM